jgi:mono/diheme cytochrome c family protein
MMEWVQRTVFSTSQPKWHPMSVLVRAAVVVVGSCAAAVAAAAAPRAALDARHKEFLAVTCGKCHATDSPEANFRVDDLPLAIDNVAAAERWQKVLAVLNAGEMPPKDEPQPNSKIKTDYLADLSHAMVVARKSLSDQHGAITMRRLNRREFVNTL